MIPSLTQNDFFLNKILSAIDETRNLLSEQYNSIIKEQITLDSRLSTIEKRLENLEIKLNCNITLDGFAIDAIKNHQDFMIFLQRVQKEKEFR